MNFKFPISENKKYSDLTSSQFLILFSNMPQKQYL